MQNKFNHLDNANNSKYLDELCAWIDENLGASLGLNELVAKTNLSNKDLQYLFEKYKQTTPMTYIRRTRESKKYLISKK
jgi:transcriptional regulator GlxA family with amidase domain